MSTGTVKWFSGEKGFGFITQDDDRRGDGDDGGQQRYID